MAIFKHKIGKQGTWSSAFLLMITPIIILFSIRWFLYEPFVIPSASMEPTLLAHDHIFVNKFSYGIRYPIGDGWLLNFASPKRGDVVVFRYPKDRNVFFVKRLIGLPGDLIEVTAGEIKVNGAAWGRIPLDGFTSDNYNDAGFRYFLESISNEDDGHFVKFNVKGPEVTIEPQTFIVPTNSYFVMGDNRDNSHDSRFWGYVNRKLLIGKASFIWLSCDQTLQTAPMICDPTAMRPRRMFIEIK